MDLSFTPEEVAFRQELRTFFTTAIPQSIRTKVLEGQHLTKEEIITAQRILNANGLAVPNWPVEWGGKDWSPVQVYIYQDEMQLNGVPSPLAFNTSMVGAGDRAVRHRCAEEAHLPSGHLTFGGPASGRLVVPGVLRAGRAQATVAIPWVGRRGQQKTWDDAGRSMRTGFSCSAGPTRRRRSRRGFRSSWPT